MNILNRFEPGHARIVYKVGLVIEHYQLIDIADYYVQIYLGISSRPNRSSA